MLKFFEKLREDEVKLMYRAPVLVVILLAGADNKFDKKEINKAISLTKLKVSNEQDLLHDYYREVAETFENDLKEEISSLPAPNFKRNALIVEELRRLNIILPKLDRKFAIQFYESLKEISSAVAHASGGILGYMTVGYDESKYVDLNFIRNPGWYKKPESKV